MENHKISKDLKKWALDKSKLSAEDLEVLKIVNFPHSLGYRQAAQKRIKRRRANSGFIDREQYDINEFKYTITNKNVAFFDIQRHTPNGRTPEELARAKDFIKGVLKTKANKYIYIDASFMDQELNDVLTRFSTPKPTPNMKAAEVEKPAKKAVKKANKKELTAEQIEAAKDKLTSGEMDLKETAKFLGVTQKLIKETLKL